MKLSPLLLVVQLLSQCNARPPPSRRISLRIPVIDKEDKQAEVCGDNVEFHEDFIRTNRRFQMSKEQESCVRGKYVAHLWKTLDKVSARYENSSTEANVNQDFCTKLINNYGHLVATTLRSHKYWYMIFYCDSQPSDLHQNCIETIETLCCEEQDLTVCSSCNFLRSIYRPLSLGQCNINNSSSTDDIRIPVKLYNILNTLPGDCSDLLCKVTEKFQNLFILSLNKSTDPRQICSKALSMNHGNSSCYSENEFCFYLFKEKITKQYIVFITKDTETISESEKTVFILRNLVDFERPEWCDRPLNHSINNPHSHIPTYSSRFLSLLYPWEKPKVNNYFFCNSTLNFNDTWLIKEATEGVFLIAMSTNVSVDTINSNVILKSLLLKRTMISPIVYNLIVFNYTLKHYINLFSQHIKIPAFAASRTASSELENILKRDHDIYITKTEYFTKYQHKTKPKCPFNMLIYHKCFQDIILDDKGLLLFLYNDLSELDIEYICRPSTAVLLTEVKTDDSLKLSSKVPLLNHKKNYSEIVNKVNGRCHDFLRNTKSTSIHFYHFLLHSRNLDKTTAIEQLMQKLDNLNDTRCFESELYYGYDRDTVVIGLTKMNSSNTNATEFDGDNRGSVCKKSVQTEFTLWVLTYASLTNNVNCMKTILTNNFSSDMHFCIEDYSQKTLFVIGQMPPNFLDLPCFQPTDKGISHFTRHQKIKTYKVNSFWPTCEYNKVFGWTSTPNTTTIAYNWDYLSSDCKAQETVLFIISLSITVITLCGNTVVILVLIFSKLIKKSMYQIFFSIAVADLLLVVTAPSQAHHDTLSLMNGEFENTLDHYITFSEEKDLHIHEAFSKVIIPRRGWPAYCAILMNISVISSLMSLSLLSIMRMHLFVNFLPTYRKDEIQNGDEMNVDSQMEPKSHSNIKRLDNMESTEKHSNDVEIVYQPSKENMYYENDFPSNTEHRPIIEGKDRIATPGDEECNIKGERPESSKIIRKNKKIRNKRLILPSDKNPLIVVALLIIWIWSTISAIFMNLDINGSKVFQSGGSFENNTVLAYFDPITKLTLNTRKRMSFIGDILYYIQVILASIAGIVIVTETALSAIFFKSLQYQIQQTSGLRIHHSKREKEANDLIQTFMIMIVLFLLSRGLVAISIWSDTDFSLLHPVIHFFVWWLFIAGSSWNWLIYTYRGTLFRTETEELLEKFCGLTVHLIEKE